MEPWKFGEQIKLYGAKYGKYFTLESFLPLLDNHQFNYFCALQNEVIKPTINGVLDIMKACLKAKTVRKLVFTSSAGTVDVADHQKPFYDERCWSDLEFIQAKKMTGWVSIASIFPNS